MSIVAFGCQGVTPKDTVMPLPSGVVNSFLMAVLRFSIKLVC